MTVYVLSAFVCTEKPRFWHSFLSRPPCRCDPAEMHRFDLCSIQASSPEAAAKWLRGDASSTEGPFRDGEPTDLIATTRFYPSWETQLLIAKTAGVGTSYHPYALHESVQEIANRTLKQEPPTDAQLQRFTADVIEQRDMRRWNAIRTFCIDSRSRLYLVSVFEADNACRGAEDTADKSRRLD